MGNKIKFMLLAVGVVAVLLFSVLSIVPTAAESPNMDHRYGSWQAEVTVVTQAVTFPALITFGADGGVIADEPPAPGETSGHGNWISNEDDSAASTFGDTGHSV